MSTFNFKRYKEARRGEETPTAFQPQVMRGDPYKKTRHPGDGLGYNLTTPGSQGMPGEMPDIAAPEFGRAWTAEAPDIPSVTNDDDANTRRNKTPTGHDPDDPFRSNGEGDNSETEYGTGLSTDFGQALMDDQEPGGDSPMGIHETVGRMMDDKDVDRPTGTGDMTQLNKPFNQSTRKGIFDRIRNNQ